MTSRNSKMLVIGNPTTLSGVFYDAFHKDRALWHTIHISAFDTPGLGGGGQDERGFEPPLSYGHFPRERGKPCRHPPQSCPSCISMRVHTGRANHSRMG